MIDDDDDFAEPLIRAWLKRLPDLSFLQFAVSGHHDNASLSARKTLRARHPVRLRDAHAERSCVRRDIGGSNVRMTRESAEPAQPVKQLEIQLFESDEQRVQGWGIVPL